MIVVSNWEIHVHSYPIEQGQRGFKHKFSPFENVFCNSWGNITSLVVVVI